MKTAEEILKDYPQYSRNDFGLPGDNSPEYISIDNAEKAMESYRAQFSISDSEIEKDRWISVEEKLPEIGHDKAFPYASKMILMSDGENVYYGQYEDVPLEVEPELANNFMDSEGNGFADDGIIITHWQPLPSTPKI